MNRLWILLTLFVCWNCESTESKEAITAKPRILISSDIGGTDPDDNQSMIHFLMYSDLFQTEGIISSPSYGKGSKEEILRMIDLYEKDLPLLGKHGSGFPPPDSLRLISKQGRRGMAPFFGYDVATEGSDWIIHCARKESDKPLWILVWGGLDDLAQALHDGPDIQTRIRVYWIGGPNKKWSTNSYAYIAENFPDLWFIEANASYRGFFSNTLASDSLKNENYYRNFIAGAGAMGKAFEGYYDGKIKMGDTPSLLYLMNGSPDSPTGESWGGSFQLITHSPRFIYNRNTSLQDTVLVYSIVEYQFRGPILDIPVDSACFTMTVTAGVGKQKWPGYYMGDGQYAIRYAPKKAESLTYEITSGIEGFPVQSGELIVSGGWPGSKSEDDYLPGANWYTDRADAEEYDRGWQGAMTVLKWREDALLDWAQRWYWLRRH